MPKLIALAKLLLSPLLVILSACGVGTTTYSNRIGDNGHDVLHSKARAKDGVARFECLASDSGWASLGPATTVPRPRLRSRPSSTSSRTAWRPVSRATP